MDFVDNAHLRDPSIQFGGTERLYGKSGAQKLYDSRICIVGIGGVGSWVAEALARAGVGHLTLIDMDDICISNLNRQVHASVSTIGQSKVNAMVKRIHTFHPTCRVDEELVFFNQKNCEDLLSRSPDVIVDCIDSISHKCLLLSECRARGLDVVTVGAAGGRTDPTRIQCTDLSRTHGDSLLYKVRKNLRQEHRFPRNLRKKWKIPAIFSPEPVRYPQSDGSVCITKEADKNLRLDCASGYGTAGFVTGSFGFAAAAAAIEKRLEQD